MSDRPFFSSSAFWVSQARPFEFIPRRGFQTGPGVLRNQASSKQAVWTIIGLNAAVFGAWQYADYKKDRGLLQKLHQNATLSWNGVKEGRYRTLVTSAFSHMSVFHFAFNMMAFNAFGSIMAMSGIGGARIVSLTLGSAIAGSLAWLYHEQSRDKPNNMTRSRTGITGLFSGDVRQVITIKTALGASGVAMGAGAAAACLMPFMKMQIFPIPIGIPLWLLTCGYFAVDAYFLESKDSRIGHSAHLGGAIYGTLFYFAFLRRYGGVWQLLTRRR